MTYNISIFVSGRAISPFSNQFLAFFCFVCCVLLDFVPFFAPHSLFFGLLRADLCMNTLWSLNDCPKLLWPSSFCIIFFRAETSSHRNFCTQHHIRTQIFTRRNFHTRQVFHTREAFAQKLFYIQFFLRTDATQRSFRAATLYHT